MSFITVEQLMSLSQTERVSVKVPGVGTIRVKKLDSADLIKNSEYIKKLTDAGDPSIQYKMRFAIMAGALCNEDGSPMFENPEDCEQKLMHVPFETLTLMFHASIENINELNEGVIVERAKKSEADQPSDSTPS